MEAGEMRPWNAFFEYQRMLHETWCGNSWNSLQRWNHIKSIWCYYSENSSQYHFYGCALTRQFALKVYCLNSAAAITQSEINYIHFNFIT
jgi:hypothetical protein